MILHHLAKKAFCTDEDVWKKWYCLKGDFGDPVAFVLEGIQSSVDVLTTTPFLLEEDIQISSIAGLVENAFILWKLRSNMPSDSQSKLEAQLPKIYRTIYTAKPSVKLSLEGQKVSQMNFARMRKIVQKKIKELQKRRLI